MKYFTSILSTAMIVGTAVHAATPDLVTSLEAIAAYAAIQGS